MIYIDRVNSKIRKCWLNLLNKLTSLDTNNVFVFYDLIYKIMHNLTIYV